MYPSPGTWRISLTKTNRTSWTLIFDPRDDLIETKFPATFNGNVLVSPSNSSSTLSNTCKVPRDHPVNSSVNVFWIVTLNSWKDEVVGIPVNPPIGTVKVSPFPYPYPVFLISKSMTLDPCPTTTSIVAPVPIPDVESELYLKGISLYDNG